MGFDFDNIMDDMEMMDEVWKAYDEHATFMNEVFHMFGEHMDKFSELSGIPKCWFDYDDNTWISIGVGSNVTEHTDTYGRKYYTIDIISMDKDDNPFFIEDEKVRSFVENYVPADTKYFQKQHESCDDIENDVEHKFDIYIHQTQLFEDSYSGYMCLPMKDGRYWVVYYEC